MNIIPTFYDLYFSTIGLICFFFSLGIKSRDRQQPVLEWGFLPASQEELSSVAFHGHASLLIIMPNLPEALTFILKRAMRLSSTCSS